MQVRGLWVIACALFGCTQSNSVVCGALICSEAAVCSPSGDACVLPTQLDACKGKVDDDPCTFPGVTMGACVSSVCIEVVCGNGHKDAITGEVCDDGNRISGDGCSADCKSNEMCGNGVVDLLEGEECDCGLSEPAMGCALTNSTNGGAECRPGCKRGRCGDGILDPTELCDDGNVDPGDGCRADCQGRWTQMTSNTFVTINDVFALSPTEAYAVGETGHFLLWNGTHWQLLPGPPTTAPLIHVWAASQTAVWVLEANNSSIWHYNGNTWTPVDPRGSGTGNPVWQAIWGTGVDDIWIVGADGSTGLFSHLNSSGNWTMFTPQGLANVILRDIYVPPGSSIAYATENPQANVYTLSHTGVVSPAIGGITRGTAVGGTSTTDIVVWGGTNVPGGKIYNGTTWTTLANSSEMPFVSDVSAVRDGTQLQQVAVGGNGATTVCDGTTCTVWSANTSAILTSVSAYGYNRAFIVGTNGTILY